MNATIVGSQLGDEGKGSIVDLFGDDADVVVRYQGGANAGHTVVADGETYQLRLVPSGVVRGSVGVLGTGCVVDLETLFDEIDHLRERGLEPDVRVAARASVVTPYHRILDRAEEAARGEHGQAVGTTGNGIGPAYEDRAGRRGVRVADLLDPETLRARLEHVVPEKRRLVEEYVGADVGGEADAIAGSAVDDALDVFDVDDLEDAFDVDRLVEHLSGFGERLAAEDRLVDAGSFLTDANRAGRRILFEGAQGTHIDVDHGGYPFVTSSNPTVGGAIVGTGVEPSVVADGAVVGVVKAYLSRVGRGPMPTELDEESASTLREKVGAFGTVTGRPRRIGWLDLPMLRYAARVNGFTGIAINHVDALAGLERIRVCTAYELDGEVLTEPPATAAAWARCTPRYEEFPAWRDRDWRALAAEGYEALPEAARGYVEFVSEALECPVYAVSVGPDREETIVRRSPFESRGGANGGNGETAGRETSGSTE